MSNVKFKPGEWVTIKYGEYAGLYGKVCMLEKSGSYIVIPYDRQNEPGQMRPFRTENLESLPAYVLGLQEFKDLVRAELFYSSISDQVFPPFNIRAEKNYKLTARDIIRALKNINQTDTPLTVFKEWFWLIINVFYENLKIEERYDPEGLSADPQNADELFSDIYGLTEKLYWRLEERFSKKEDNQKYIVRFKNEPAWDAGGLNDDELEKAAYFTVCNDIIARVSIYEKNRRNPEGKRQYSLSQKKIFIADLDGTDLGKLPGAELEKYRQFVLELAEEKDAQAMRILAWSYYEGTAAFGQNWEQAEKWLLALYKEYGDPFAANSLGYIYYYGRVNGGMPEFEKAFKFFSFGALAGIDESIYKAGDMLIHGKGTTKSIDMGINMIVDGYRACLDEFCFGAYDGKFADYALRMGNICSEKLIYGMGMRDAYKFYLEALFAIRKRRQAGDFYGDRSVERRIEQALHKIRTETHLDPDRKVLKADFPIYINQLFEDPFPLKILIRQKNESTAEMILKRFRLDPVFTKDLPLPDKMKEIPEILVCYPELSYAELTSQLTFGLENVTVAKYPEQAEAFYADGFRKNELTGALEFYSGGELIAAVEAEWYVIDITGKPDPFAAGQE